MRQRTITVSGLLTAVGAGIAFTGYPHPLAVIIGALLAALTLIAVGLAPAKTPIVSRVSQLEHHAQHVESAATRPLWAILAGILLLALLTIHQFFATPPEMLQFILWISGITLIVTGASRRHSPAPPPSAAQTRDGSHTAVMVFILLTAFAARVVGIESLLRVLVDEMTTIRPIVLTWDETVPLLTQISGQSYPYAFLYPYVQQVGGVFVGHSLFGLRMLSAITGTLTCAAVYVLGRTLYNQQIGLIAAALLAVFPLHIHFSRLGILNIHDPLLVVVALIFVYRAIYRHADRGWVYAGLCLGLTHYLYEGGRLFHTPLVLLWVALIALGSDQRRRIGRGALTMITLSIIIAAPLYLTWIADDAQVFGRFATQNITADNTFGRTPFEAEGSDSPGGFFDLLGRLGLSFALYVAQPDEWLFYGGEQGMVPLIVVPFFLVGLGASLFARNRWSIGVLPALWVLATATATGLLIWNPTHAARHTVALPGMALVIAVGVWWTVQALFTAPRRQRIAIWGIVGLLSVIQIVYYFGVHLPNYNFESRWVRGYRDPDDAVLRMIDLPPNTQIYMIYREPEYPMYHSQDFLTFITDGDPPPMHNMLAEWMTPERLNALDPAQNYAFFIEPENTALLAYFLEHYPTIQPSFSPNPDIPIEFQLALFFLPSEEGSSDDS